MSEKPQLELPIISINRPLDRFLFMDSEPDLSRPSTIKRYPRRIRMGGFLMNVETATAWASRLAGRTLDPIRNSPTIYNVILQKVRPYRVNFKPVGEVADVTYMVITQSAWFKGHKDMDPSLIPHFEEGEREAVARKLLDEQGVHDFEFTTILG